MSLSIDSNVKQTKLVITECQVKLEKGGMSIRFL